MIYYLLHDNDDPLRPYALLADDGSFSKWVPSMKEILSYDFSEWVVLNQDEVSSFLANPIYPIIATYNYLPTVETNPELLL